MDIVIEIPDDLAERLGARPDLPRRALEALALEAFKAGRLSRAELRRLLGFSARLALDAFLKSHDVAGPYSPTDLERDRRDLARLGL